MGSKSYLRGSTDPEGRLFIITPRRCWKFERMFDDYFYAARSGKPCADIVHSTATTWHRQDIVALPPCSHCARITTFCFSLKTIICSYSRDVPSSSRVKPFLPICAKAQTISQVCILAARSSTFRHPPLAITRAEWVAAHKTIDKMSSAIASKVNHCHRAPGHATIVSSVK